MTLYKGTTPIAGLSTNKIVAGRFLLEPIWSDHIINDIQYLRADTFSWQDGDVYTSVYNKLVDEYSTGTEETEGDITFKRTTNGFKICSSDYEANVLAKYNSEGIAWYYILDTTNKRFKLPRTKFGFEGLRTNVGDDIAESLPSHKHTRGDMEISGGITGLDWSGSYPQNGAFKVNSYSGGTTTGGAWAVASQSFYASRSWTGSTSNPDNEIYQDNAPVQERATQMYLYFYVGEYAQSAIEQTAGLNAELFNGKLDNTTVHIVETYINGTSGYNIWSNGYCEQWGQSTSDGQTVTFTKTFANTNYSISGMAYEVDTEAISSVAYRSPTASSIVLYAKRVNAGGFASGAHPVFWKVSGYLAEGEY